MTPHHDSATLRLPPESLLMRALRAVGFERLAWSLRRLHVPVAREALVLEVGSGDNPYPRANVLLDAYEESGERATSDLVADRPLVLGRLERLPFRDGAFDFVIASHVIEHLEDVDAGLRELMRVGRAGYIETPDALFERLNPYTFHRLELRDVDGRLHARPKSSWRPDPELVSLYERRVKALGLTSRFPFEFHLRYYWQGRIDYVVENPTRASGDAPPASPSHGRAPSTGFITQGRGLLKRMLSAALSQRRRNQSLDVLALLRCVQCEGTAFQRRSDAVMCTTCSATYPTRGGTIVMIDDAAHPRTLDKCVASQH